MRDSREIPTTIFGCSFARAAAFGWHEPAGMSGAQPSRPPPRLTHAVPASSTNWASARRAIRGFVVRQRHHMIVDGNIQRFDHSVPLVLSCARCAQRNDAFARLLADP